MQVRPSPAFTVATAPAWPSQVNSTQLNLGRMATNSDDREQRRHAITRRAATAAAAGKGSRQQHGAAAGSSSGSRCSSITKLRLQLGPLHGTPSVGPLQLEPVRASPHGPPSMGPTPSVGPLQLEPVRMSPSAKPLHAPPWTPLEPSAGRRVPLVHNAVKSSPAKSRQLRPSPDKASHSAGPAVPVVDDSKRSYESRSAATTLMGAPGRCTPGAAKAP